MKIAQLKKYNKDSIRLNLTEALIPEITENDVLLKVVGAGVNPLDNMISRGEVKLITPYKLPLIAGNEVVGIVDSVGSKVRRFKKGDRVFARLPLNRIGAFAEYVSVDSAALAQVPSYLSNIEAAAVPLTALTIIQSLELMGAKSGETLFISGGTGGVGAMAIPIAKARGLTVITNGSISNKERVLELGADRFIDYKTEDYSEILSQVDNVLDTLGGSETEKQMRILKKGGRLVSLRGMPNGTFAKRMNLPKWKQLLFGLVGRKFDQLADKYGVTYDFIFVESNGRQLQEVADLLSELQIKPSIDTVYSFEQINEALDKVANGRSRGKTVISFEEL